MKILSVLLFITFLSCKTSEMKSSQEMFTSGKYEVLSMDGMQFSEQEDYKIRIDTTKKYLSGKFDCNEFGVEYDLTENNTLNFGFARATKMYCEGEMDLENKFFRIVNSMTIFKYKKGELSFYNTNKDLVLKLKKIES